MSITCLVLSISTTTPDDVLRPTGRAIANVSASAVAWFTEPVGSRPVHFWKAITACFVVGPYSPSTPYNQNPSSINRCWTRAVPSPPRVPTAGSGPLNTDTSGAGTEVDVTVVVEVAATVVVVVDVEVVVEVVVGATDVEVATAGTVEPSAALPPHDNNRLMHAATIATPLARPESITISRYRPAPVRCWQSRTTTQISSSPARLPP